MTQCQCTGPGYCERHKCTKTAHQFHLCQTSEKYFDMWEQGVGPGQVNYSGYVSEQGPEGLGDKVAKWLQKVGITEENYKAVKEMFGLPPTCNCGARKAWLNKVGRWIAEHTR